MTFDVRRAATFLVIAGVAGAALFLPAVGFVGSLLLPAPLEPTTTHVAPLVGQAIWARANGGQATELQPINPFTLSRMATCHVMAEQLESRDEREAEHDECMKLLPGVQAIGYLSGVHMKGVGVWQDPRVPFVQIGMISRISSTWTRAELIDTLADRAEFGPLFRGAEAAARGYFKRSTAELTVPQAALLAALIGQTDFDPWCKPEETANLRRQVLARMRDNGAIDGATYDAADPAELGLVEPPPEHQPCAG